MQYRASDAAFTPSIDLSVLARRSLNSDLLYPGDVVDVTVLTGAENSPPDPVAYRIHPNGEIEVKVIGPVVIAGRTLADAEEEIRRMAIERRKLRDPSVTVLLNTREADQVRVVGEVNKPGLYDLPRAGSDLLAALVAAEGLTEDADTIIEVRHPSSSGLQQASFDGTPSPSAMTVNLKEAMQGDVGDLSLRDGSVVMVRKYVPEKIYVHGLVPKDGEFELPRDQPLRVTQAVALAGGRLLEQADTIHVTRFVEGRSEPVVIKVSMKEAKANRAANPILMAEDVVSVEETPMTFTIDFLRNYFRVGFSSAIPGF